jgi:hypothetical protein
MGRYQNSGSQPAAEARRTRHGGREGRTGPKHGLDGGRHKLRGLGVDEDVPAEQNVADDPPGMRRRVTRASGIGLGDTRDCRRNGPGKLLDTPDLQYLL